MFTPERRVIKKHDRSSIRVTVEYVQELVRSLPNRDFEILHWLFKRPFMTGEQIEMLVFGDLKPSSRREKANQRIRKLYHSHCIDRWFPPVAEGAGSSKQHLVLDRAGLLALALKRGIDPSDDRIKKWRKRNHIPQNYQHTLKIQDFYGLLHLFSRQLECGEIIRWEWEDKAKIKFAMREDGRNRNVEIKPDAFCIYKYNTQGGFKMFYLEADNATEDMDVLETKIRRYKAMYESGEWRDRQWARATQGRMFPAVLFLFHDLGQAKELHKFAKRQNTPVRFLFTAYDQLIRQEVKEYHSRGGKTMKVPQEQHIRLFEPIFLSSKEEGEVPL